METRLLTPDDRPELNRLISEAFVQGRPAPNPLQPDPLPDGWHDTKRLGMFNGGNLIATVWWHDMALAWDHGNIPMGGVAGVMCTAQERGQGHVDRLLKKALFDMRETGYYFSGLHPFEYSFYKRYGYGWVGERYVTTLPVAELPSYPEGRNIKSYEGMDAKPALEPIYAEFCAKYRGMHLRKGKFPDWWARTLRNPTLGWSATTFYSHVYTNPNTGKAEGYMVYRFEQDRGKGFVQEFVALTPESLRGLLSALHYYGTQIKTVALEIPADDPLPLHVMSYELEREVKPHFMARIVDVKPALEVLKPKADLTGSVTIQVDDKICDWNNSLFQIEIESGSVTVSSTSKTPDVVLNIEQLTQAYWGWPSLAMLRRSGMIEVASSAGFEVLSKLLPETVTFMTEFF